METVLMKNISVKEQLMVKIINVSGSIATKLDLYQAVSAVVSRSVATNRLASRIALVYCI
jgi:hypothetical protein